MRRKVGCALAILAIGFCLYLAWPFLSLTSYLLPKTREYHGSCTDNLRAMGKAFDLYYEAEAQYPPAQDWMDRVSAYLRVADRPESESQRILRCPDLDEGYGYAFNAKAQKGAPAPLVYDSSKSDKNAFDAGMPYSFPKSPRKSGTNILWTDGRVGRKP
jgi:hypothetical protein